MTLDAEMPDDPEEAFALLQTRLWEDRKRIVPEDQSAEVEQDPEKVAFLEVETWQTVLLDLGYVPSSQTPFYAALGVFVGEARQDPAFAAFEPAIAALAAIVAREGAESGDDLLAVDALLEVLAAVLSFEVRNGAERFAPVVPDRGSVSVWSRIVQARLDRLGLLMHTGVGHPWGEEDETALLRLSRLAADPMAPLSAFGLSAAEQSEQIALSGDADALIARLRHRDPGGFLVAKSSAFPGRRDAFYNRLKVGTDGYFSSAPLISFAPALRRLGSGAETRHEIAQPLHADAESALADASNRLGLRLVQIKLWQQGYYEDAIDAVFGPNTVSAILEAVEIHGNETLGETLPDVMRRLGDGQIAITLHGLDRLVFAAEMRRAFTPEVAEVAASVAETITERRAPANPEDAPGATEMPELRRDARDPKMGFLGRIRNRVGRVFKTTGRILRAGLNVIRRGVANMVGVVDRMLAPVRDLMSLAFEDLDKVRYLLRWTAQTWRTFLLGRPLAVGSEAEGFATVQFSIDRDARLLFLNRPSDAVLAAFREATNRVFRIMGLTFKALATVLRVMTLIWTWPGRVRLVFELLGLLQTWFRPSAETDAALA